MAADDLFELKRLIQEAAADEIRRANNRMGIPMPGQGNAGSNPFGSRAGARSEAASFTVGYNSVSKTNVIPFTTDVSILYGDGVSGDILTGS